MLKTNYQINEAGNCPHALPHEHQAHLHKRDHRHDMLTVLYEEDKLSEKFGEIWPFHVDAIAKEPPEMKILFALINGCKVRLNFEPEKMDPCCFENPSLSQEILEKLKERLGIESDIVSSILEVAPKGVVSTIVSLF